MQSKKAILFLMTVVTTCLHAEYAKNMPHTYANASWRFWQSRIWTWLDVSQRLGALGANSCESANSCLDYEEPKVHLLLTLIFAVCHHLSHTGVITTDQWNRVLICNERCMPTLCQRLRAWVFEILAVVEICSLKGIRLSSSVTVSVALDCHRPLGHPG